MIEASESTRVSIEDSKQGGWPELRFYHLERMRLEVALPALLRKCIAGSMRAAVLTAGPDDLEQLSETLWLGSYFLPHGPSTDQYAPLQPICLLSGAVLELPPNQPEVLFQVQESEWPESLQRSGIKMVCDLFNGADTDAVNLARSRWSVAKQRGQPVTYWKQSGHGWSQK